MTTAHRAVLDSIHVLDTKEVRGGAYEICATTAADYDEESRELQVELDSFVRRVDLRGKDTLLHPPWLPRKDCVRTHADLDEAPECAREMAKNWAAKVRRAIPSLEAWQGNPAWLT